jgi:hypothetical protein
MTSPSGIERTRGAKESSRQLEVLRERWPLAFPIKHQDVRPLAASTVGVIAATMGWSTGYTRAVLFGWKMTGRGQLPPLGLPHEGVERALE